MDKLEQKKWIKKHLPFSSGARITEMLKRYWLGRGIKENNSGKKDVIDLAKEIFS